MSDWNIPGCEIAIAKDNRIIYSNGFGYTNLLKTIPVQTDNLFRIASVSKSITAIAIMQLVQKECLSLDDTVFGPGKILDQSYYLDAIQDQRVYSITVKNLLEHTAGWNRDMPCDEYEHSDPPFFPLHVTQVLHEPNPVGDTSLIKFSLLRGLHTNPGEAHSYSNIGYLILGKIVEKVSGMKYDGYVRKTIFEPLGISHIYPGKNLMEDKYEREVEYSADYIIPSCYGNGEMVPAQYGGFNLEAMNAHGGWISNAEDLIRLLSVFDSANPVLSGTLVKLMKKPSAKNSGYAKGWSVNEKGNAWHTGSIDGSAAFICKTANGYSWAILLNSRADNSLAFWKALDRLPWNCLDYLKQTSTTITP